MARPGSSYPLVPWPGLEPTSEELHQPGTFVWTLYRLSNCATGNAFKVNFYAKNLKSILVLGEKRKKLISSLLLLFHAWVVDWFCRFHDNSSNSQLVDWHFIDRSSYWGKSWFSKLGIQNLNSTAGDGISLPSDSCICPCSVLHCKLFISLLGKCKLVEIILLGFLVFSLIISL